MIDEADRAHATSCGRADAVARLVYADGACFFDPPYIIPVAPVTGEVVSFVVHLGVCDAFLAEPGFPQTTQTGNAIVVREYGAHYEDGDELCIYPTGTFIKPFGVFQPGDYTFTLEFGYYDNFGVPTIRNMGTVAFAVAPPPTAATPLPINNKTSLWVLMFSLLGAAAGALRFRRYGT